MPATAAQYGVNPADPQSAITGAAHYDSDLTKQFGGNTGLGLAAYNWGPGNVKKWLASGANPAAVPAITRAYVQNITGKPLEAWLTGPQAASGDQRLAFAGDPAQTPTKTPGSPQAMSEALAGQPSNAPQPDNAPQQVAENAATRVAGSPRAATQPYSAVGTSDPNAHIGAMTPPRAVVSRQQAIQAAIILRTNPTDPVALSTYDAYMKQNQPIEANTAYGGKLLLDPHDPRRAPVVIPGEGHWGEETRKIEGMERKVPIWQGVAPPGSSFGAPQVVSPQAPGGEAPSAPPAPTAPVEPPGPPPPSLIPSGSTPTPPEGKPEGKRGEAEGKTRVASLEPGTMTDAGPGIGPVLAAKPPEGTTQPTISTAEPPKEGTKVAQTFPGWDKSDAQLIDWSKHYNAEKGALADLYKKDVETYNKNLSTYRDAETSSYSSMPQLKILQSLINDAHTIQGPLADPKIAMATAYAALGDKASMKMLDFDKSMDKVVNSSIMKEMHSQLAGWAGQVRNSEILMLTKAMASKHNTLAANRAIIDIYMKYADQAKHLGEIARGYSAGWRYDEKGQPHYVGGDADRPTATGLDSAVKTYLRNNPLYTDEQIFGTGGTKEHPTGGFMKIFQDDEAYKEHTGVRGTATTGYTRPPPSQDQLNKAILRKQQQQSTGGS
jgi:hypothetical protein